MAEARLEPAFSAMPFPTIGDVEWQRDAIVLAMGLYRVEPLQQTAAILARSSRFAAEYLQQLPALAVALHVDATKGRDRTRHQILIAGQKLFGTGRKLKDVAAGAKLALQLRGLPGPVLRPTHRDVLEHLSSVLSASELAQALLPVDEDRGSWLSAVAAWQKHVEARSASKLHLGWAATALSRSPRRHNWREVADFALHRRDAWNDRWSWDAAARNAEEWHRELAKNRNTEAYFRQHGRAFDEVISYGRLPTNLDVADFSFTAIQTGEALYTEGRDMRHCVASYARAVISGRSRIYSIKQHDKPVATIELRRAGSGWAIEQIKGPHNAKPAADVMAASELFLADCNARKPLPRRNIDAEG